MILASAPARLDLAGGTLDIWPLCHLLDRPAVTVNVAIDLGAEIRVEDRNDGVLEVVSEDYGETVRLPVDSLRHDRLGLATRMAEWYGPGSGLSIRMRSKSPPHAGLGASSALAVALALALGELRGVSHPAADLLRGVQSIETAVLRTPTGYQDYYPAFHGGVNVIEARPDGVAARRIDGAHEFAGRHLQLVDTGCEHHSGLTNWEVVRRFLDGDELVRAALDRIAAAATAAARAIEARDLGALASAVREDWSCRRTLSPVVTNERIDAIVSAATTAGALAAKVCGAGGGGCLLLVVDDARDERTLEAAGARPVRFRTVPELAARS